MIDSGIDLVHIPDFKQRLEQNGGVGKVFTDTELAENTKLESLAGVFAAKEAFMKAIGKKINWHDVWIEKEPSGRPILVSCLLTPAQKGNISISHAGDYAIAVVVLSLVDTSF